MEQINVFRNTVISKNDFFKNPEKVLSLFDRQEFQVASAYPGIRSPNLLESDDDEVKNFALHFVERLSKEVFIGLYGFMIDLRFHINTVYDNPNVNEGWIHNDEADLAGLVYLTPEEFSLDTGTSLFAKKSSDEFQVKDYVSRQKFNTTGNVTEEYLNDLAENHRTFIETIRVGNIYNRLLAYDAKLFHKPNRYNLDCKMPRKSIVFFIRNLNFEVPNKINLNSTWRDE